MSEAMMAYPDLRHPFEEKPLHPPGSATVLCQGRNVTLSEVGTDDGKGDALLIRPDDLPAINGFTLKPEGACYADMCIPIDQSLLVERNGEKWFDLTAFADSLGQTYVADTNARVWSFAEIPAKRNSMMIDAMAPEFEVTDREGQVVRMADLKGKKALIVTWSSW
jgi:hypothetical protein